MRAAHLTFSKTNFDMIFGEEKQVLSASSCLCGRALYHRVHNYASPPDGGKPSKCSDITSENSASAWILVAYWPIPNRDLSLTSHVILLMVVSSLLTEAKSYEFSRNLEYYLWYTLANYPIGFWNRLNPTFTMAEHFFWHPTSTIGTTTPPNTEIWSMSGAICKIMDIFWRLEDAGTRQNKINFIFWIWKLATPQVTWNVLLTITQGNDLRYTTSVFSMTKPTSSTSERFNRTANLHVSM